MIRRLVPHVVLPLILTASLLASAPWLRSFPAAVLGAPIFGAALLSVLIPVVLSRTTTARLWMTVTADVVCLALYILFVVLHSPLAVSDLVAGLVRGPAQLLTFALPLVSPRTLMVAPVALTWFVGALAGECIGRRWFTVLPYAGFLVCFGLSYAATIRAGGANTSSVHLRESLLAAGLLATLSLLRASQTWIAQDEQAEITQADGVLPLRGLRTALIATILITLAASLIVQNGVFPKHPVTPQRVPSVNDSKPVTPVSFVAGIRPRDDKDPAKPAFTVRINHAAPGYFSLANVDSYDGAGWDFTRTFLPSGGVLPADPDQALTATGPAVQQQYQLTSTLLSAAPWMPYLYRPSKVTGVSVNIDPDSGMIVPARSLADTAEYSVESKPAALTFSELSPTAAADPLVSFNNLQLQPELAATLSKVIASFSDETGVPASPALPFLHALQTDLTANYQRTGTTASAAAQSPSPTRKATPPTPANPVTPTPTAVPAANAGSTTFADVLASILGSSRTGTPEQYATLVTLIARELGVPARVATGFRIGKAESTLAAGSYDVGTDSAWTWVEIPIAGVGWVVLDPTPAGTAGQRLQPNVGGTSLPTPTIRPSQGAAITRGNDGHAIAPKSAVPSHGPTIASDLVFTVAIVLGVLLLMLLMLVLLRKPIRARRRRGVEDPRAQVINAWRESIDLLTEAGLPTLTNLTNAEIAQLTYQRFGDEPAAQATFIGSHANRAVYATQLAITVDEASQTWQAQRVLRKSVRHGLNAQQRIAAALRYHRNRSPAPLVGPTAWSSETPPRIDADLLSRTRRRLHARPRGRRSH